MVDFNTLVTDKTRIISSIFWVLGAIFSLITAIRSFQADTKTS